MSILPRIRRLVLGHVAFQSKLVEVFGQKKKKNKTSTLSPSVIWSLRLTRVSEAEEEATEEVKHEEAQISPSPSSFSLSPMRGFSRQFNPLPTVSYHDLNSTFISSQIRPLRSSSLLFPSPFQTLLLPDP